MQHQEAVAKLEERLLKMNELNGTLHDLVKLAQRQNQSLATKVASLERSNNQASEKLSQRNALLTESENVFQSPFPSATFKERQSTAGTCDYVANARPVFGGFISSIIAMVLAEEAQIYLPSILSLRFFRSSLSTSSQSSLTNTHTNPLRAHPLLDFTHCPPDYIPSPQELQIVPNFLPDTVHDFLVESCDRKLKRLARGPYAEGHFDGVIKGYKEANISSWGGPSTAVPAMTPNGNAVTQTTPITSKPPNFPQIPPNSSTLPFQERESLEIRVMTTLRDSTNHFLTSAGLSAVPHWLAPHILELRDGNSGIGPHVDHLQAMGDTIAGLCLISDAVMIFRHVKLKDIYFSVLLPKGCWYMQRGKVRYEFTHEIPIKEEEHFFKGSKVERGRRISVLIRNPVR
ncbi:hypothetical protein HDV05_008579 [Chytridiales sp. JEL 0842]|nr:hypothetical protein HDV05_008579 [Chytridiales sp. JEL 0842]